MIRQTALVVAVLFFADYSNAQSWTSFQNGGKLQSQGGEIPTKWDADSNIQWQSPIVGYGQSTPVMFKDRVYVTSVAGENKETINVEGVQN